MAGAATRAQNCYSSGFAARWACVIFVVFVVFVVIGLLLPSELPPIALRPMARRPCSTPLHDQNLLIPELSLPVNFDNRGPGDYIFMTFVIEADRDADIVVRARTTDGLNATVATMTINPTGNDVPRLSSVGFRIDIVEDSEATYVLSVFGDAIPASFANNDTDYARGVVTFDFLTGQSATAWVNGNPPCVVSRAAAFSRHNT